MTVRCIPAIVERQPDGGVIVRCTVWTPERFVRIIWRGDDDRAFVEASDDLADFAGG